jgi:hypothetical protein
MSTYNENCEYWLWFISLKGIGIVKQRELLKRFKDIDEIYKLKVDDSEITTLNANDKKHFDNKSLEKSIIHCKKLMNLKIKILDYYSLQYYDLWRIDRIPNVIYYKGKLPPKNAIVIFGKNSYTENDINMIDEIVWFIKLYNVNVVIMDHSGVQHAIIEKLYAYTNIYILGTEGIDITINKYVKKYPDINIISFYGVSVKYFLVHNLKSIEILLKMKFDILFISSDETPRMKSIVNLTFKHKTIINIIPTTVTDTSNLNNYHIANGHKIVFNLDGFFKLMRNSIDEFNEIEQMIINSLKEDPKSTFELTSIDENILKFIHDLEIKNVIVYKAGKYYINL